MFPLPPYPGLVKDLRALSGVGPQLESLLHERGMRTVGDLLAILPTRYQDRRFLTPIDRLTPETEALVAGRIEEVSPKRSRRTGRSLFEITVADETGRVKAYWFRLPAYMRRTIKKGDRVLLFGRVQDYHDRLYLLHPEMKAWDGHKPKEGEIRPVYPEMEEIKAGVLRRIMKTACRELAGAPPVFPADWLAEHGLTDPIAALKTLHRPQTDRPGPLPRRPRETRAWRSLALFELVYLQLSQGLARARLASEPGLSFPYEARLVEDFLGALPFRLTDSQTACLTEIRQDLAAPRPMNRLLQGDVGSGKTVLALAACLAAVSAGYQAALMAPTEILARQHARFLAPYAESLGVATDLLVGGLNGGERSRRLERLATGETKLVIGTHALFSPSVAFQNLGLVVVDEQHRFGVAQRLALREKAGRPNVLVMSATPIPRSLALVLYGDLDISFIEGLPPGRKPVETRVYDGAHRREAYRLLTREIAGGGQAYLVAPRIEAVENGAGDEAGPAAPDLAAAEELFRHVDRHVLPETSVGLLHGRMKPDEREEVLSGFRQGRIRALVSTTVIEVGLDVGAATVMLVEGAERFGLAQLHQLRGRVGRGDRPALCLLVGGAEDGPGLKRLRLLAEIQDGFALAEEDLKERGPGDAAGLRQSGLPALTFARLPADLKMLHQARDLARDILARDPDLSSPGFRLVREVVDRLDLGLPDAVGQVG